MDSLLSSPLFLRPAATCSGNDCESALRAGLCSQRRQTQPGDGSMVHIPGARRAHRLRRDGRQKTQVGSVRLQPLHFQLHGLRRRRSHSSAPRLPESRQGIPQLWSGSHLVRRSADLGCRRGEGVVVRIPFFVGESISCFPCCALCVAGLVLFSCREFLRVRFASHVQSHLPSLVCPGARPGAGQVDGEHHDGGIDWAYHFPASPLGLGRYGHTLRRLCPFCGVRPYASGIRVDEAAQLSCRHDRRYAHSWKDNRPGALDGSLWRQAAPRRISRRNE